MVPVKSCIKSWRKSIGQVWGKGELYLKCPVASSLRILNYKKFMPKKNEQYRYIAKKEQRALTTRIKRISKIARSQSTITWSQEEAIRILELRKIGYIREKRIFHHNSFYLIDIFIPDYNMCVEIDGSSHDLPENIEKDKKRDQFLKDNWYWVFRIKNEDIRYFWKYLRMAIGYRKFVIERYWSYKNTHKR